MRDSFIRALTDLAAEDPRVMLVSGDLGFSVLDDFIARFPDAYVNAGVAEQNMTAVACGMALTGARAYTYSIANFPTLRCLEQLRNDVCYHRADVTVVAVGGGFSYGQLGMSHFATEDLAILRALPEMTVVAPSDPWQAYVLTCQMHARGGPGYLRLDKGQAGLAPGPVTLGRVRTVRDGDDAVIFAVGGILSEALGAAELLAAEGVGVRVVEVHTLKPFDVEGVRAAARACPYVLTLEEHSIVGGLGGAVAEACLEGGVAPRGFSRIGLRDLYPSEVGDQAHLRAHYGLDRHAAAARLRAMLDGHAVRALESERNLVGA
ncbi:MULTISPECIES: transketolase family protein [unclassified Caulobacter]|jgi:transketolase|uniref:transketolase family protein n=1 Tax=unclassified Caulobacter TaxID=2648921 RepID=UPI0009EAB479|nr:MULTISPECIES: transketolase C-terminal domain-containing protein [unclassified Caulobacter]